MPEATLPNGITLEYLKREDLRIMCGEMPSYFEQGIEVRAGDTVIDVGANIGLFALWVDQLADGQARVYSFEPIPAIFAVLERNLARTNPERLQAFPCGLSDAERELTFTYFPGVPLGSTAFPDRAAVGLEGVKQAFLNNYKTAPDTNPLIRRLPRWLAAPAVNLLLKASFKPETVTCRVRTLSSFIEEHALDRIDLLKVDAEYAERDILAGIDEADWRRIGQALVEVHDGRVDEVAAIFSAHGFSRTAVDQQPILKGSDQYLLYALR